MSKINEKYISKKKLIELFSNILYSIKSKPYDSLNLEIDYNNNRINNYVKVSTRLKSDKSINTNITEYRINIKKYNKLIFKKYNIELEIITNTSQPYISESLKFNTLKLNYKIKSIIKEIFNYLINVNVYKEQNDTNNQIENVIDNISKTIDNKFKRNDKLNKLLNNKK